MVTDDSCRDLNSKQMATVMTLSSQGKLLFRKKINNSLFFLNNINSDRRMNNELNISCLFPDEIQQYEWYSLNQTIEMLITNNDIEFLNHQEKENNQRFHCLQSIGSLNYRIRSFTNW